MDMEFDPAKAASNLKKHGVSFAHAEQEDPDAEGEPRYVTLGMDALGRLLVVVYTLHASRIRVISARKAGRGEQSAYHA